MKKNHFTHVKKKSFLKRFGAALLATLLVFNNVYTPGVVKAGSIDDRYELGYSLESLLTYFQYVTSGDCLIGKHTVGPVAVGGTFDCNSNDNTIGDGAKTAAYAKNIKKAVAIQNKNDYAGVCDDFYYETTNMSGAELEGFTYNPDYMDLAGNFASIKGESTALTNDSMLASVDGDGTILIDFDANPKYTVTYDMVYAAKKINIEISDIAKIKTQQYVLNFTGFEAKNLIMNAGSGAGETGDTGCLLENRDRIGVFWNGVASDFIQSNLQEDFNTGQVNLKGMKLIFNFPDATGQIATIGHGGHIVAPNATVSPVGGRFEGGIIAKSIVSPVPGAPVAIDGASFELASQAHYYPYNTPTDNPGNGNGGTPACSDIVLKKIYADENGTPLAENAIPATGAKFTLFDMNGNPVENASNIEVQKYNSEYKVIIRGANLSLNTSYYLQETTPAEGFELNDTKYYCKVDTQGNVTYALDVNSTFTSPVLTCENRKSAQQQEQKGSIIVYVKEETNSGNPVEGVDVTITGPNGVVGTGDTTDEDGKVSVTNLPIGVYTVTIGEENSGYVTLSPEEAKQEKTVSDTQTTEYIFILNPATTPQPEVGTLVVVVKDQLGNPVEGATVVVTDNNGTPHNNNTTDADGKVTITNMPVGDCTSEVTNVPAGYTIVPEDALKTGTIVANETEELEHVVNKTVSESGKITVHVKEKNSSEPVKNVSVVITGPSGKVGETLYTDSTGNVAVDSLPYGQYTVTIGKTNTGYITLTDNQATDTKEINSTTPEQTYEFVLEKTGNLTITVVDENTGVPVPNAKVTITHPDGSPTEETTDSNGEIILTDIPTGDYTTKVTEVPDGYTVPTDDKTTNVPAGSTPTEVIHELPQVPQPGRGTLIIVVKDQFGNPVENVSITVKDADNVSYDKKTDANGKVTITNMPVGDCSSTVTNVPEGYKIDRNDDTQTGEIVAGETTTLNHLLNQVGKLQVIVVEEGTETRVSGVYVTISGEGSSQLITSSTTDIVHDNLSVGTTYTVSISQTNEGYVYVEDEDATITKQIVANNVTIYKFELKKAPQNGDLVVKVREKDGNKAPIDGVAVTVKNSNGETVVNTVTDDNGTVTRKDLPAGQYTVVIGTENVGYVTITEEKATKTPDVIAGDEVTVIYELEKAGNLTITVVDENTGVPVPNAKVTITHPDGSTTEETTDSNGKIILTDIPTGDYTTKVTEVPDGYTVPTDDKTTNVPAGSTPTEVTHEINKVGKLSVLVKEKGTNTTPVAGVEVTVSGPNGYSQKIKTNANGMISLDNLPVGNYTVTIPTENSGYIKLEASASTATKAVEADKTTTYIFELEKQPVVNEPAKGALEIVVVDEKTNDPVPNAKVTVTDSNGNTTEYTTDNDGKIVINDLPTGTYKIEVKEVPDGYTVTTNVSYSSEVVENTTTKSVIKVNKNDSTTEEEEEEEEDATGDLLIVVKDEVTGKRVPNAKVEVTDPNGKTKTYKTDENGEIEIFDVPEGKYTVVIIEVPDGYTVTTDKKVTASVKKNKTTKKVFKIKTAAENPPTNTSSTNTSTNPTPTPSKTVVSSQPKTGDETNPGMLFALFGVSFAMVIISAVGIRKTKKN